MSKRFWAVVVIVIVGLGAAVRMTATAQAPKAPAVEFPFKGKVVVYAHKKLEGKTALQDPSIKRLGEIDFLTGQVVGHTIGLDWRLGAVVWIPLADISEMAEFKDLREAKRKLDLNP